MEKFISKRDSNKPLYLQIGCEELRFIGLYGQDGSFITNKISSMPSSTPDLFLDVINRVENDMQLWAEDYTSGVNENLLSIRPYIGK